MEAGDVRFEYREVGMEGSREGGMEGGMDGRIYGLRMDGRM